MLGRGFPFGVGKSNHAIFAAAQSPHSTLHRLHCQCMPDTLSVLPHSETAPKSQDRRTWRGKSSIGEHRLSEPHLPCHTEVEHSNIIRHQPGGNTDTPDP